MILPGRKVIVSGGTSGIGAAAAQGLADEGAAPGQKDGLNFPARGNRTSVPLFRCPECGFVTTASWENALAAHEQGSPHCAGPVELIADFARFPAVVSPAGRRRRSGKHSSAAQDTPPPVRPAGPEGSA